MSEKKVLTIMEAAKELGISKGTAYAAAHSGDLPVLKVGGRLLVPRVAFDRMLEQVGKPDAA